ncbi:MAG: cytochrome C biogenesis protein CcdA [Alphaproteobacteria bacterium]|jgi:cytochrome c-type biogenesis protein|nr:MAG: cytochrome C biogenesis protein CcdA [Alphaproteobacteria bacterium]
MIEISNISIAAAFAAGVISFLSPCVLPLVPGYVSYIAGHSIAGRSAGTLSLRLQTVALSGCFVLGFSTIFVLLGASATALGQVLLSYRHELNLVGGAIVVAFGLLTLGLLRPAWLQRDHRLHIYVPGGRPVAAYVLGLAFGFGWTPCIGPILGAILTVSAGSATVATGVTLLSVYSFGLGLPFVLAAAFTDGLVARLRSIGRLGRTLQAVAGVVMIIMGGAMITGHLSTFSFWLLDTFPVLSTIG